MDEYYKEYQLRQGNTFEEIDYYIAEIINGSETPINLSGAAFKSKFVNKKGEAVKELTNEDFDLTNAANGYFKMKKFIPEFLCGDYFFDIRIETNDLTLNTPIEKLKIKKVITGE